MATLSIDTVLARLAERVPPLNAWTGRVDGESLPYVVFGELALDLLDEARRGVPHAPAVEAAFRLVTEMAESGDPELLNLATVGVYEVLCDEAAGIALGRAHLAGPAREAFERAVERWGPG